MLNKELSHLSESSKSGNQISEYICSTFLGEFDDEHAGLQPFFLLQRTNTAQQAFIFPEHKSNLFIYQSRQTARSRCADIRQSAIGWLIGIDEPAESSLTTHNVTNIGLQTTTHAHQLIYKRSLASLWR
jgi:hypothetical protein